MDPIKILEMVNAFYSNAFSQLVNIAIWIMGGVGLIGVLLPLVMQQIQFRYFRDEKEKITSRIEDTIEKKTNEIRLEISKQFEQEKDRLNKQFRDELSSLKNELHNEIVIVDGGILVVQGERCLKEKQYTRATVCFADAARNFVNGGDEQNISGVLRTLIEDCLPYLYSADFDEDIDESINSLVETLRKKNNKRRFSEDINEIKKRVNEARNNNRVLVPLI